LIFTGQRASAAAEAAADSLRAGFAETDITPELGGKPVYLAGFGQNRKATGIHDPLKARAVVLQHGGRKLAVVAIDLIGFFHAHVARLRTQLLGYTYVLVSSTHNHDGPDTLGLWGPNPFGSGVDPAYLSRVEGQIVRAVRQAESALQPVRAVLGTSRAPELLHDAREPYVKHDELVALQFLEIGSGKPVGTVVQWNCHPETLDRRNTEISADFVGATVAHLGERYRCPVVYLTGTVGGLMTSLQVPVRDERGKELADGTFAKAECYGRLVGRLAERALQAARPVSLTPWEVRSRDVYLPLANPVYLLARRLGILERQSFLWAGNPYQADPLSGQAGARPVCLRTEIAWLRLGDLHVAAVPGEIYPELVLDKVQDPPDPGADFPDAPAEPAIYTQLGGLHRMLIGLANDEIGYIIPKRQWDEKPPYCYGRRTAQYGEMNSLGPDTAPLLCRAFKALVKK
jgi:hypothetical protein